MPSPFRRKTCRPFPKTSRAHQSMAHAPVRDAEAAPTRGKTCRKGNAAFFARKTCRLFPKTSAHINQGRTRLRVKPKPLRLVGKHVVKAMRLSLLGKHVVLSQTIARTSIKGARASRVMPKPLRLAGKHVVRAMRLSLLKKLSSFPKTSAHINQGRTRIARDAEAAPTRGKICRKSNAALFA